MTNLIYTTVVSEKENLIIRDAIGNSVWKSAVETRHRPVLVFREIVH